MMATARMPGTGKFTTEMDFADSVSEVIRTRFGLILNEKQRHVLNDAVNVSRGADDAMSDDMYLDHLRHAGLDSAHLQALIDKATVPESYFFRDARQMKYLRETWLPEIIREKRRLGSRRLRIWTPGCASGQDTYTLAVMLRESIPDIEAWNISLLGSDIDAGRLRDAEAGVYSEWSLRAVNEATRVQYFHRQGDRWLLDENIRKLARFRLINLLSETYPAGIVETQTLDLIFCRNVFIYFNEETAGRVLARFGQCIGFNGRIVLGTSDLNAGLPRRLGYDLVDGFKVYRRNDPAADAVTRRPTPTRLAATPQVAAPAKHVSVTVRPKAEHDHAPSADDIRKLLAGAHWAEADEAAARANAAMPDDAELLLLRAEALANLGDLANALDACRKSLACDPKCARAHLVSALVHLERGDDAGAEAALKQAVFLNPDDVEAHYHIAHLHLRHGHMRRALAHMRSISAVTESGDADAPCCFGLSNAEMARATRAEIEHYAAARGKGA